MANIRKINNKDGSVSYKFTVSEGRDINNRQIRHYLTWTPPTGMTPLKAEKEAQKQAIKFEEEVTSGILQDPNIKFADFANKWYEEYASKQLKAKTHVEYKKRFPRIFEAFGHKKLKDLNTGHLNSFYANLQEKGMNVHTSNKATGKNLKELIKKRKMTMLEVSKNAELSANTVYAVCRGKTISKDSAVKIAKALNMKFSECFSVKNGDGYLSSSTVRTYHRLISSILSKAVKWGYIAHNQAINAELPKMPQHEAQYLEEEDAKRLLDLLQHEPVKYQAMITFDLMSGLRRGEMLGLRWGDIDFEAETIQVKQTSAYVSGMGVITDTPKNTTSKRPLRLSRSVFVLLRNYREWQDEQKELCGNKWRNEDDRIFTNEDGSPIFPDTVTGWFSDFIKRSGLPKATIHSLRHTYASLMIANGTPMIVVSKRLGHAQTSTTGNIYAHMIRKAEEKAMQATDIFDEQLASMTMKLAK